MIDPTDFTVEDMHDEIANIEAKFKAVQGDCAHNLKIYTRLQNSEWALKSAVRALIAASDPTPWASPEFHERMEDLKGLL